MYQLTSQLAVRLQRLLFPGQKPEYINVNELMELADKRAQSAQQDDSSVLQEEIELKNQSISGLQNELIDARTQLERASSEKTELANQLKNQRE